jgi:hypothetical protein
MDNTITVTLSVTLDEEQLRSIASTIKTKDNIIIEYCDGCRGLVAVLDRKDILTCEKCGKNSSCSDCVSKVFNHYYCGLTPHIHCDYCYHST